MHDLCAYASGTSIFSPPFEWGLYTWCVSCICFLRLTDRAHLRHFRPTHTKLAQALVRAYLHSHTYTCWQAHSCTHPPLQLTGKSNFLIHVSDLGSTSRFNRKIKLFNSRKGLGLYLTLQASESPLPPVAPDAVLSATFKFTLVNTGTKKTKALGTCMSK